MVKVGHRPPDGLSQSKTHQDRADQVGHAEVGQQDVDHAHLRPLSDGGDHDEVHDDRDDGQEHVNNDH